jgi:hypothetical protein
MDITVLFSWVVTPYSLEKSRLFEETYHLHLQGRRVRPIRYQQEAEFYLLRFIAWLTLRP